jgi:hypothetical protein
MVTKTKKYTSNPLTNNEKKQINLMMDEWFKIQKMEQTSNYKNKKKIVNTKKSLKRRSKKVDNIIKKYK